MSARILMSRAAWNCATWARRNAICVLEAREISEQRTMEAAESKPSMVISRSKRCT